MSPASSEEGVIPKGIARVLTLIGIVAVPAGLALTIVGCVKGTGDARSEHGFVQVPGSGVIELPAEEVLVSFQESGLRTSDPSEPAERPQALEYTIRPQAGGAPLQIKDDGGSSNSSNGTGSVPIGKVKIETVGRYVVASSSRIDPADAQSPTILLGEPRSAWDEPMFKIGLILLVGGLLLVPLSGFLGGATIEQTATGSSAGKAPGGRQTRRENVPTRSGGAIMLPSNRFMRALWLGGLMTVAGAIIFFSAGRGCALEKDKYGSVEAGDQTQISVGANKSVAVYAEPYGRADQMSVFNAVKVVALKGGAPIDVAVVSDSGDEGPALSFRTPVDGDYAVALAPQRKASPGAPARIELGNDGVTGLSPTSVLLICLGGGFLAGVLLSFAKLSSERGGD